MNEQETLSSWGGPRRCRSLGDLNKAIFEDTAISILKTDLNGHPLKISSDRNVQTTKGSMRSMSSYTPTGPHIRSMSSYTPTGPQFSGITQINGFGSKDSLCDRETNMMSPQRKMNLVDNENCWQDENTVQISELTPIVPTKNNDPDVTSKAVPERLHAELKNSLTTILSALYATIIVVIGSVLSMTESFLETQRPLSFELFYIFIYSGGICFLLFIYVFLLRKESGKKFKYTVRKLSFHENRPAFRRMVSYSNMNHTGGFYLRLGAIGFGIGGMILDGLYIAEEFEDYGKPESCHQGVTVVTYIMKMVFAFSQLYFVFNNAEMKMLTHQNLAKFGLMHMTATNICEWYRTVVVETLETLSKDVAEHQANQQTAKNTTTEDNGLLLTNHTGQIECMLSHLIGSIIKDTSPYLYPFKIEYNLICAGIVYVMWRHMAYKSEMKHTPVPLPRLDSDGDKRKRRLTVDCSSSSRGLFLGILIFVTVVILLKSFYSLVDVDPNSLNVIFVANFMEIGLYCVALISTIVAAFRMKDLKFDTTERAKLEENFIGISQLGLLMYCVFSVVAGSNECNTARGILTIITNIFMMLQASLQTIFLFTAMRMSAHPQQVNKPGREFVTFLLLCNFCMWVVNTFETIRPEHNAVQIAVYGEEAWAIFVHISIPLAIFYRFHSTVCLSHIWKYAWKTKADAS